MDGPTATQRHAVAAGRYRILSDSPAVAGPDPLEFDRLAERLERTIVASYGSAPFTVSVEAGWGAGKSTLMRRLQHRLDRSTADARRDPPIEIKTVWFNAWTAPKAGVLEGLVRSVLDELDRNIVRRAARNRQLVRGLGIAASVAASLVGLGNIVDRVWKNVADDPKRRNQLNDFVRDAMQRWLATRPNRGGGLIVVFVDDLDRCSSTTVMEVFEAVKLYLDAPGLVFVLGWDTEQVIRAVSEEKGDTDRVAYRYVEKIVQFGYRIQRPTDRQLEALLASFCDEAGISTEVLGDEHRELLTRAAGGNPRQMKRFLNRFVLLHQIVAEPAGDGRGAPEVVHADVLILLLVLQASYDAFFRLLTTAPDNRDAADDANPLVDFAEYQHARRAVDRNDTATLTGILERNGYTVGEDIAASEVFLSYERDRPREFPSLAQDPQFVDLVGLMSDEDKRSVWALARSAEVEGLEPPETVGAVPPGSYGRGVAEPGATVLWIDDHPKESDHAVLPPGVELITVATNEEAQRIVQSGRKIDLLISDIGRGARRNSGLEGVASFRSGGMYDGPVVFYTANPTAGQVEDATTLRADVTSSPRELAELVRRYLPTVPDGPQGKMSSMS